MYVIFHVDSLVEISTATGAVATTVVMAGALTVVRWDVVVRTAPIVPCTRAKRLPTQAIATVRIFRLRYATRRPL